LRPFNKIRKGFTGQIMERTLSRLSPSLVITTDSLSEFVSRRNFCPRPVNKRKEGLHWPDQGGFPIEAVP
jgi:hypothetical protein